MSPIWPFGGGNDDGNGREPGNREQEDEDPDGERGDEIGTADVTGTAGTATGDAGNLTEQSVEALVERARTTPESLDVEAVIDLLDASETAQRRKAGTVLTELAGSAPEALAAYTDRFTEPLADPREDVRVAALTALRDVARTDPAPFRELVEPVRDLLGDQSQDEARLTGQVLVAVLSAEDPVLTEILEASVDRLREAGTAERGDTIRLLSTLGVAYPEPTIDRVEPLLAADERYLIRYGMRILSLVAASSPSAAADLTPRVFDLLESDDDQTSQFAAEFLSAIANEDPGAVAEHVDSIAAVLTASDDGTRRDAIGVLVAVARTQPEAVRPLIEPLVDRLDDRDRIVRRDACYVLGVLRADAATEPLEAIREESGPELSTIAERAFARIDGETGEPPLEDIPPKHAFQKLCGGDDSEDGSRLSPEEREAIRQRRLERRNGSE